MNRTALFKRSLWAVSHARLACSLLRILLALSALLLAVACNAPEAELEGDQYLVLHLGESLKGYDSVRIDLVDADDTSKVLENIHDGPLPDPAALSRHRLGEAKGRDFTLRIQAWDESGDLAFVREVRVADGKPGTSESRRADARLWLLTPSRGSLEPAFSPGTAAYVLKLGEADAEVAFAAKPMDPACRLSLEGKAQGWGDIPARPLDPGYNEFAFAVEAPDGSPGAVYRVTVLRGEPPVFDTALKMESVKVEPKSLLLYMKEAATVLTPSVRPARAGTRWESLDPKVAAVDSFGRVMPGDSGRTKVILRAGDMADTAEVQVLPGRPVIDAGPDVQVRAGSTVTFPIRVTVVRGSLSAFKYSLDGEGPPWQAADTAAAPASVSRAYPSVGSYKASFHARDSRGMEARLVRTVTVVDGPAVAIVSPRAGALLNGDSVAVAWTVDGVAQTTGTWERLDGEDGIKTIVREAKDPSGAVVGRAEVRVAKDTKEPDAPRPATASPTFDLRPRWTWTASEPGTPIFRFRLDTASLDGAPLTSETGFQPRADLALGEHTLYVQERDAAGNWSAVGQGKVTLLARDVTPPERPQVRGASPTNTAPRWTWSSGGGGGAGRFEWKLGSADFSSGATATTDTVLTLPGAPVSGTTYTLHVRESDTAGNWSAPGSRSIRFDSEKPGLLITSPAVSGRYVTRAASVSLSGQAKPAGNPVVRVTFRVGDEAPRDAGLSGDAWSTAPVELADGIPVRVTVTAHDAAGNSSDGEITLLRDAAGPTLAITSPAANPFSQATARIILAGSVGDLGAGVASVSVSGYDRGAPAAVLDGLTWRSAELTLVQGANDLKVTALDAVGNATERTLRVNVDVPLPTVTITYPPADFATNLGSITLRYRIDGGSETSEPTPRALTATGPITFTVESAPNEVGRRGVGTVTIIRDIAAPNAPTVSALAAITRGSPTWSWTSGGDASGGGGMPTIRAYRYRLNGGAETATATASLVLDGAAEGVNRLQVAEQDRAGNWSAYSAEVPITVDRTAPVVTLVSPPNGTITSRGSITITYTEKDGAAQAVTRTRVVQLADMTSSPFTLASQPDLAGNVGELAVSYFRRSNVTFVRTQAFGTGDGTSWADATGNLATAIQNAVSGDHLWVASGRYFAPTATAGFSIPSGVRVYGSFNPSGNAMRPEDRTFAAADISEAAPASSSAGNHVFSFAGGTGMVTGGWLDGFRILVIPAHGGVQLQRARDIRLGNLWFVPGTGGSGIPNAALYGTSVAGLQAVGLRFSGFSTSLYLVNLSGDGALDDVELTGNTMFPMGAAHFVYLDGPRWNLQRSRFLDALAAGNKHIQYTSSTGDLTVDYCTFKTATNMAGAIWTGAGVVTHYGTHNSFVP